MVRTGFLDFTEKNIKVITRGDVTNCWEKTRSRFDVQRSSR